MQVNTMCKSIPKHSGEHEVVRGGCNWDDADFGGVVTFAGMRGEEFWSVGREIWGARVHRV